jgi:thioesterase domain-containing protein
LDLSIVEQMADPKTVVRTIAERCIDGIRAVQPRGPYFLGGHSFGGVIAFEIACLLSARGERVPFLGLIDPDPPKSSLAHSIKWTLSLPIRSLRRVLEVEPGKRWSYLRSRGEMRQARLARQYHARRGFAELEPLEKLEALVATYRPPTFPGRITLFIATDKEKGFGKDPALAWVPAAAGGTETHMVPGDHLSLLRPPNVKVLAALLTSAMERAVMIVACCLPMGSLPA